MSEKKNPPEHKYSVAFVSKVGTKRIIHAHYTQFKMTQDWNTEEKDDIQKLINQGLRIKKKNVITVPISTTPHLHSSKPRSLITIKNSFKTNMSHELLNENCRDRKILPTIKKLLANKTVKIVLMERKPEQKTDMEKVT